MGTHPIFESDFDCLTVQKPDLKCQSKFTKSRNSSSRHAGKMPPQSRSRKTHRTPSLRCDARSTCTHLWSMTRRRRTSCDFLSRPDSRSRTLDDESELSVPEKRCARISVPFRE